MNILPKELIIEIVNYIDLSFWNNLIAINKYIYNIICKQYNNYILNKKLFIINHIPEKIVDLLNGYNNVLRIPILEWKDCFSLDNDRPNNIKIDLLHHPIMMSVDKKNRCFIILCTKINKNLEIDILFKKYSSDRYTWANATSRNGILNHSNFVMVNNIFYNNNNSIMNLNNFKMFLKGSKKIKRRITLCGSYPTFINFEKEYYMDIQYAF